MTVKHQLPSRTTMACAVDEDDIAHAIRMVRQCDRGAFFIGRLEIGAPLDTNVRSLAGSSTSR
jgi:hypothetical protein